MTAEQLIKKQIIKEFLEIDADFSLKYGDEPFDKSKLKGDIDEDFDLLYEEDYIHDAINEFRQTGESTDLPCEWSRHYDSEFVARQLDDGNYVGWTYWSGGGKHGEPEAIDWMSDAKILEVASEEMVVKRNYKIKE